MITDPRPKKIGRISLKLQRVSKELPNIDKAKFFLRNAVRLTRIVHHQPPFKSHL